MRWIYNRAFLIYDPEGKPYWVAGIAEDGVDNPNAPAWVLLGSENWSQQTLPRAAARKVSRLRAVSPKELGGRAREQRTSDADCHADHERAARGVSRVRLRRPFRMAEK